MLKLTQSSLLLLSAVLYTTASEESHPKYTVFCKGKLEEKLIEFEVPLLRHEVNELPAVRAKVASAWQGRTGKSIATHEIVCSLVTPDKNFSLLAHYFSKPEFKHLIEKDFAKNYKSGGNLPHNSEGDTDRLLRETPHRLEATIK